MKNTIYCMMLFIVFFSSCTKKNNIKNDIKFENDAYMFKNSVLCVNSQEGLNIRNIPSIDGEKIGTLSYLTEILIMDEDVNFTNINGIYGKWVQIATPIKGWIFSGYLEKKDKIIQDALFSEYTNINNNNAQLNLLFDSINYYNFGEEFHYNLEDYQIDEVNIILQKNSWLIENNPEARGFTPNFYTLENKSRVIAYINNIGDSLIIIIKNLITGGNIAVYYAPINIYSSIENYILNNFK